MAVGSDDIIRAERPCGAGPCLAPNGRPSLLSPEDWAFVRGDAFKARFGDWEKGDVGLLLDANGEPMPVYHGTTKDFDAFDVSCCGENTGLGTYADHITGKALDVDSAGTFFFSDNVYQAASYALLGRYHEVVDVVRDSERLMGSIRTATVGGIVGCRDRKEFMDALHRMTAYVPSLASLPFPLHSLSREEREAYAQPLKALRDEYSGYKLMMDVGGLSNQHYNVYRQAEAVESVCRDFGRLRRNDATVSNEFGTFERYDMSLCGASGNAEACLRMDGGRMVYHRYGSDPEFLDAMDGARSAQVMEEMRALAAASIARFKADVVKGGYDAAVRIYKVFLRTGRALEHDYKGSAFPDRYLPNEKYSTGYVAARQVRHAREHGYGSVIYRNVRDPFLADTFGIFDADRIMIRSVIRSLAEPVETPVAPRVPRLDADDLALLRSLLPADAVCRLEEEGRLRYAGPVATRRGGDAKAFADLTLAVVPHAGGARAVVTAGGKAVAPLGRYVDASGAFNLKRLAMDRERALAAAALVHAQKETTIKHR